jgi:hypothetical protein
MSWGSALPYLGATPKQLAESQGIPQFQDTDSFYLVQNGLILQGGVLDSLAVGAHTISFPAPFQQQILTIQLTEIDGAGIIRVDSAPRILQLLGLL